MPASQPVTPLPLGRMYAAAWGTYRSAFARVVGISLLLFVPATALNAWARHLSEDADGVAGSTAVLALVVALVTTVVSTMGASVFAGIVDFTVHAHRHGEPQVPVHHVVRQLPYWRMAVLSFAVAGILTVAFILLVIPGLIGLTLLSIAGPLLVLERLSVRGAIRRSAHLTRPHFWRVVVVIVLPVFLENTVVDTVATYVGHTLLAETAIHGALAAVIYAYVMLLEVHTAHWLSDQDRAVLRNS